MTTKYINVPMRIDTELLAKQRRVLGETIEAAPGQDQVDTLEGIRGILDAVHDTCFPLPGSPQPVVARFLLEVNKGIAEVRTDCDTLEFIFFDWDALSEHPEDCTLPEWTRNGGMDTITLKEHIANNLKTARQLLGIKDD